MADFPTAKTNAVDNVTDVLAKHINNLESKVGIDGSADTSSLDYKVGILEAALGGWISANETWSYHSATEITVPSGAVSRYRKGMPFKVTANSVELQGYIVGVADTLLTVVGDTLTDHTFTDNNYAPSGTFPVGFTGLFSWTPTVTANGSMTYTSQTIYTAQFFIVGIMCYLQFSVTGTIGGTLNNTLLFTLPVAHSMTQGYFPVRVNGDGSEQAAGYGYLPNTTQAGVRRPNTVNYTAGAGRTIDTGFSYAI